MQITSVTSSGSVTFEKTAMPSKAQPVGDQVSMSMSAETFSGLVSDTAKVPEVRSEVVEAYQARIQAGKYPDEIAIEGLINLMGGRWTQGAKTSGSAESES